MRNNSHLLSSLFQHFHAHFTWKWLQSPGAQVALCTPSPEFTFIGYFHPDKPHLVNVQAGEGEIKSRGDEKLIILTDCASLSGNLGSTRYEMPILATACTSPLIINTLHPYLYEKLAPQFTLHGVLLDIFGKGVLLTGPSGCGKSRLAMQLLARGHRLIADDAPLFSSTPLKLMGSCPSALQNLLAIRELGITDVTTLYGPLSVMHEKSLDLIINLSNTDAVCLQRLHKLPLKTKKLLHHHIPTFNLPFAFDSDSAMLLENAVKVAFNSLSNKSSVTCV